MTFSITKHIWFSSLNLFNKNKKVIFASQRIFSTCHPQWYFDLGKTFDTNEQFP